MSAPQIDLYTASTPNGWKVSVFLEEVGMPYTVHRIDLGKGDQNSTGVVPLTFSSDVPAVATPRFARPSFRASRSVPIP